MHYSTIAVPLSNAPVPTESTWFYSTLAQSAAAIVGLLGAFTVAGLIRQRDVAAREHAQLVDGARVVSAAARPPLEAYQRYARLWRLKVQSQLSSRSIELPMIPRLGGAPMVGPATLAIGDLEREALSLIATHASWFEGAFNTTALENYFAEPTANINRSHFVKVIGQQRELEQRLSGSADLGMREIAAGGSVPLETLLLALDAFTSQRRRASAALATGPLRWVVTLMSIIATTGVVAPLYSLAGADPVYQYGLLGALAVELLALLSLLWIQIGRLTEALVVRPDELS